MKFFDSVTVKLFSSDPMFKKVQLLQADSTLKLTNRVLPINEKISLAVDLPPEGELIKDVPAAADFFLFLQKIVVGRDERSTGIWTGGGFSGGKYSAGTYSGGKSSSLQVNLKYALWDNRFGKVIAYGNLPLEAPFLFVMTKSDWVAIVKGMKAGILKNSPFKQY
ncbi:MAG: hypothetical protein HYV28_17110 [Ignavibacteriales bacterium]|nr:hypothetical protein [Ignavibacteriales bacterium]